MNFVLLVLLILQGNRKVRVRMFFIPFFILYYLYEWTLFLNTKSYIVLL